MDEVKYEYDALGNIVSATSSEKSVKGLPIPDYNIIKNEDDESLTVIRAKQQAQRKAYQASLFGN